MGLSPSSSPWISLHHLHGVTPSSSPQGYLHPPLQKPLCVPRHAQDIPQGLGLSPPARWLRGAGSAGARLPAQHQGPDGDEAVGRDVPRPGRWRGCGVRAAGGRGGSGDGWRGPRVAPGTPGFPIPGVNAGFFGLLVGSVEAGVPPGAGGGWRGPRPLLLSGFLGGWGPPRGGRSRRPRLLCGRDGGLGWRGHLGGTVPPPPVPTAPLPSSSRTASDRELSSEALSSAGQGTGENGAGAAGECQNAPTAPAATQRVPGGLRSPSPTPPVPTRSGTVAVPARPALLSCVAGTAGSSQPAQAGQEEGCWAGLGAPRGKEPPCPWSLGADGGR